jgi:hypothetical protein
MYWIYSPRRGSKPLTWVASAISTRGNSAAIGSSNSKRSRPELDVWEVCLLTADPSIIELLYGPLEGVSTHKPVVPPQQFILDHLTTTDKNAERQVYE